MTETAIIIAIIYIVVAVGLIIFVECVTLPEPWGRRIKYGTAIVAAPVVLFLYLATKAKTKMAPIIPRRPGKAVEHRATDRNFDEVKESIKETVAEVDDPPSLDDDELTADFREDHERANR